MKLTGMIASASLSQVADLAGPAGNPKAPRTWVLLADSEKARLFCRRPEALECLGEAAQDDVGQAEISNKTVGRVVSSAGSSVHHKFEPPMAESRQDALLFVREIADWLDKAARENAFDALVVAAPPRTLGDLRKALGKQVRERLVAEVGKDLTKASDKAILAELDESRWHAA